MNIVSLIGRLTAAPVMKTTQTGTEYVKFSIAVDRPVKKDEEKQADFINIVAWKKTAAFVCKYFSKGQRIAIIGSIRTGSYTDRDGNKRYTTEVYADNVEFCESKNSSSSYDGGSYSNNNYNMQSSYRQEAPAPAAYSSGDTGDFVDMPSDDDLPF